MKKIKTKEPKPLTLALTAVSGVALGVLLGISILLSRPANVVKNPPDLETVMKPGNYSTYVVSGRVASSETPNLKSGKGRISRRSPGPVSFSEEEINYFFDNIEFDQMTEGGVEGEEAPVDDGAKLGPLNIRIAGEEIYASYKMVLDPKGDPFELMAIAKLKFVNTESGPELKVSDVRINSLPLPGLGGLVSSMITSSIASAPWPEDLYEMWQNIREIEVESDKVVTEVGLRRA